MDLSVRRLHPLFVGEVSGVEHATRREFLYRHEWCEGDLVIWDNRCTMHRGRAFDEQEVRDLRRVTTRDPASTLDQVA